MLASHARYLLDASVAAKWFTRHEEADRHKAVALRALHVAGRCALAVPEFALLEILNAVRFSGRADETIALRALVLLERLRMDILPLDWPLLRLATSIAWADDIALYDAAYVALSEHLGVPFVTADEALVRKISGRRSVVRLAELEIPD